MAHSTPSENNKRILPTSLLFVCSLNAVRSPMAEAITKKMLGTKIYVDSVGIRDDLGSIDPFTISVMKEMDIDITGHKPKNFGTMDDNSFDLVITLSPEAHHRALDLTRFLSTDVEYWPTMDPTSVKGNRETIMAAFRSVRDYLEDKIKNRFDV